MQWHFLIDWIYFWGMHVLMWHLLQFVEMFVSFGAVAILNTFLPWPTKHPTATRLFWKNTTLTHAFAMEMDAMDPLPSKSRCSPSSWAPSWPLLCSIRSCWLILVAIIVTIKNLNLHQSEKILLFKTKSLFCMCRRNKRNDCQFFTKKKSDYFIF